MRIPKRSSGHRRHRAALAAVFVLSLTSVAALPALAQTPDTPQAPVAPPSAPAPDGTPPSSTETPTATTPPPTTPSSEPAPSDQQPTPAPHRHTHIGVGLDLGLFAPTSSHTRNRFGNSWFSVGLGIGSIRKASTRGHFAFELSTLYKHDSDHHAFFAPVGVEYRRALGTGTETVPYVGLSGDLVFADLRSPEDNVHSGFRETGGGSVFVGTTFSERGFVEARYLFISKVKGFDLSGLNLTAGVRFLTRIHQKQIAPAAYGRGVFDGCIV